VSRFEIVEKSEIRERVRRARNAIRAKFEVKLMRRSVAQERIIVSSILNLLRAFRE